MEDRIHGRLSYRNKCALFMNELCCDLTKTRVSFCRVSLVRGVVCTSILALVLVFLGDDVLDNDGNDNNVKLIV